MKSFQVFKSIALAFVLSMLAMNVSAQQPGRPGGPGRGFQMTEDDIKAQVDNTAQILKMNEEQQKKALAADMDFYNKMQIEFQKMRNEGGPPSDREAMRDKMMKMRDDRNAQYEAILTPDQYKQFVDLQEQRMRDMREQRQQANPGGDAGTEQRPERGRGRN